MSIPRGAPLETVLEVFENPAFVVHQAVEAECGRGSLHDAYACNVELMAQLDAYSQLLVGEMSRALADLQRGERRIKYQYELLRNDVETLASRQAEAGAQIAATVDSHASSEALKLLQKLENDRTQIENVKTLLEKASRVPAGSAIPAELAAVFKGTPRDTQS